MNYEIRKFEDEVVKLFNSSTLPVEVKRLIATNVQYMLSKAGDNAIVQEIRAEREKENEQGI